MTPFDSNPSVSFADPRERIIWSADVGTLTTLKKLLGTMPDLQHVKLDRLFLTENGLAAIREIQDLGVHVFADAKIAEIPSKVEALAELHLRYVPYMLNCMAGCCSTGKADDQDRQKIDGLMRFSSMCRGQSTRPCAVTVLTSKTPEMVGAEYNGRTHIEQVLMYVELLIYMGFSDIVCSPAEVPEIRQHWGPEIICLNVPGIRPAGSAADDQARADTPEAAIAAGADRLVIGRPITDGDPSDNLARILASIS